MAGTKIGGKNAAATNRARHGADYYAKMGAMGGKSSRTGGFWYAKNVTGNTEFIQECGAKGGRISRRAKKVAA